MANSGQLVANSTLLFKVKFIDSLKMTVRTNLLQHLALEESGLDECTKNLF